MRRSLLVLLLLFGGGCSQPCALFCDVDSDCVQQGVLPGFYCQNHTCLPDCYRCNAQCVATFDNCGACGHACAATEHCSQGQCKPACAAGEYDCSGSCYDLSSDRAHCGDCNTSCGRDQVCVNNACTNAICG